MQCLTIEVQLSSALSHRRGRRCSALTNDDQPVTFRAVAGEGSGARACLSVHQLAWGTLLYSVALHAVRYVGGAVQYVCMCVRSFEVLAQPACLFAPSLGYLTL